MQRATCSRPLRLAPTSMPLRRPVVRTVRRCDRSVIVSHTSLLHLARPAFLQPRRRCYSTEPTKESPQRNERGAQIPQMYDFTPKPSASDPAPPPPEEPESNKQLADGNLWKEETRPTPTVTHLYANTQSSESSLMLSPWFAAAVLLLVCAVELYYLETYVPKEKQQKFIAKVRNDVSSFFFNL